MLSIEGALLDFKRLDTLANGNSPIHRLDPRAKVLTTLAFIVTVVSFGRYELTAMLPFFIFPAVVIGTANLPAGYIAKKVALLCPFALMVALFNPLYNRDILISLGPIGISGGWVSCASVLLRASLTMGATIILLAVTGFPAICRALERLGMPPAFVVQLLFLYRYTFVLTEEGGRSARARELRSFGRKGLGMRVYGALLGSLLIRSWQRAERIHMAMSSRGFTGEFHTCHTFRFGVRETVFLLGWSALFIFLRFQNVPRILGTLMTGIVP